MLEESTPAHHNLSYLSQTVELESLVEEVYQDLFGRGVLLDLAVQVEADHVAGGDGIGDLESLVQPFLLGSLHVRLVHVQLEVDRGIRVVLFVVLDYQSPLCAITHLDRSFDLLRARRHLFEHLFEVLGPFADGKLGDLQASVGYFLDDTAGFVLVRLDSLDFTLQRLVNFQ